MITLQERRPGAGDASGAIGDPDVPSVLRDGEVYDVDVDRFLLGLPADGVRSRHSLRAYGYDVMTWVRFLDEARGVFVWQAGHADVVAYHRARRRGPADTRVSARSWNRAVAALDKLYRWAADEGLAAGSPFAYRQAWRRAKGGSRALVVARNTSYERAVERPDARPVTLEDYVRFRDVGLRGLCPDGRVRPGARDRNGARNALFADLLVTTGSP